MYSLKEDRKRKFLFALRLALPVVILTTLLLFVIFSEHRSITYNTMIFILGVVATIYFIFYMIFQLSKDGILDEVTKTFNRKAFEKLFKKIKTSNGYLLLFSIENIKEINERYGIDNGDHVLEVFAMLLDSFLTKKFSKESPIAHIRGGNFLVFVEEDEKNIKRVIKEFLKQYDNAFIEKIEIKIDAVYENVDDEKLEDILNRLYERLYYCKRECRKKENIYKKERSKEFEEKILESITQNRFLLLYQPLFNIKKKRFDVVDVIVKLKDDEKLLHPSQFLPIINRLGLENRFDLTMTKRVLEETSEVKDLSFSFHLSPYSLRNREFLEEFLTLFEGLEPSFYILNLLEKSVYKDINYFQKVIKAYKDEGFQIAFDDFGSCNASFEYIKDIEPSLIYFDKIFTKKIEQKRYMIFLKHWIALLKELKIKTVIKRIDQKEVISAFESLGVDYLQGFAVAKPMPIKELKEFIGVKNEIW